MADAVEAPGLHIGGGGPVRVDRYLAVAHHRGDQPCPVPGAATWRLISPGGRLVERAPVGIAAIAITTPPAKIDAKPRVHAH
jgi:hypothetical protein